MTTTIQEPPDVRNPTAEVVNLACTTAARVYGVADLTPDNYPPPGEYDAVARRLIADYFTGSYGTTGRTLARYRGDWWRWTGPCWEIVPDVDLTAELWRNLDGKPIEKQDNGEETWLLSKRRMEEVKFALEQVIALDSRWEAPFWIDRRSPGVLIGASNGLFDPVTREITDLTPDYFNTWALPFAHVPGAKCPTWDAHLQRTLGHDPRAIDALQQFAGYLISGRCDQQKGLMVIGMSGTGKGVTTRAMSALMGDDNTESTTVDALGSRFGLWPLIGKPFVVLPDARMDGTMKASALSTVLQVIGNDKMTVDRKGQSVWSGYLPARFMWVSNQMPNVRDDSGAFWRRWVVIRMDKIIAAGEVDRELDEKIAREMPGVLNWALDGADALAEQGVFTEPSGQLAFLQDAKATASPVSVFLSDEFTVTGDESDALLMTEVRARFESWTLANGYESWNRETFMRKVNECELPVTAKHTRRGGRGSTEKKDRWVFGIAH